MSTVDENGDTILQTNLPSGIVYVNFTMFNDNNGATTPAANTAADVTNRTPSNSGLTNGLASSLPTGLSGPSTQLDDSSLNSQSTVPSTGGSTNQQPPPLDPLPVSGPSTPFSFPTPPIPTGPPQPTTLPVEGDGTGPSPSTSATTSMCGCWVHRLFLIVAVMHRLKASFIVIVVMHIFLFDGFWASSLIVL